MTSVPRGPIPFVFVAARPDGGRTFGIRRAAGPKQLSDQLRRERLVPLRTWAIPVGGAGSSRAMSLKDQAEVHTQLKQLLSRAVPLVEALEVTGQAVGPTAKPRVQRVRELVAAGMAFSDAARQVELFDPVTISVYRAAERTGDLAGAAGQLSETARRQLRIAGKAITLLIYPVIVLSIAVIMGLFMITFIVPMIGQNLERSGATLPGYTKLMMQTGLFIRGNALWLGLGAAVVVGAMVVGRKVVAGWVGAMARRLPLIRDVVLAQESARFFSVLAAMTRTGIPLADALGSALGAIGHPVLRSQLDRLRTRLIEGGVLRQLIDSVEAFPVPTRRLLIAAERSGELEGAFTLLAHDMEEELERRTSRLMAALGPLLIVFLFVMIAALMLSIMIPLIRSTTQII